jgi:membrane fusion protein, multidrug efflux system
MKKPVKLVIAVLAALIALGAIEHYGWRYYTIGRFQESTDDAYLKADITEISPKIAGYVTEVLVADNEPVAKGQVLVRIDDQDYRAHVAAAEADVAAANADLVNLDARTRLQRSAIDQSLADSTASDADQHFAQEELTRYNSLVKGGAATQQRVDQAEASFKKTNAGVIKARAAIQSAKDALGVLESERGKLQADLERKQAALDLARIDLANTTIVAPGDGVAGERMVRVGQYVKPGTQILAVVPVQDVYVVANFKETQLTRMNEGETVDIAVDSFPGVKVTGRLESLAPASGSEFSLLPPDNATGNFTKVVQRVPVKIVLDADNPLAGRLRPGMSVIPTIDTRGGALVAMTPARTQIAQR